MLVSRPLYDEFWETKRIPVENIDHIPLYLMASYSFIPSARASAAATTLTLSVRYSILMGHSLHSETPRPTLNGYVFTHIKNVGRQLPICKHHCETDSETGHDQYRPEILDDLQKFFDRYCKGILNGWENDTPRVRLSLLGFEADGGLASTIVERPEREYPLAREMMEVLFLDASDMSMKPRVPSPGAHCAYEAHTMHEAIVSGEVWQSRCASLNRGIGVPRIFRHLYRARRLPPTQNICILRRPP